MSQTLQGKVVVIAGGSSGMGLALAHQAVAAGAIVHILGRTEAKLTRANASLGGSVSTHRVDIGNEVEVKALTSQLAQVDHLVTTAAELTFKPFSETNDEDIRRMLAGKFWGPIYLVRHLSPQMSKEGSITFYSGSAAYKASAGATIVAALNAALEGMMRTLALELAPVRVNVVSPGVVDSPVWDFLPANARMETMAAIGSALPRGRVGTTAELADAGLFLMRNGYTTGAVLQIDGGANV